MSLYRRQSAQTTPRNKLHLEQPRILERCVTFLFRKRKVTNQASPNGYARQEEIDLLRGPAGCPALLGKAALSTTRYAQTSTSPQAKLWSPFPAMLGASQRGCKSQLGCQLSFWRVFLVLRISSYGGQVIAFIPSKSSGLNFVPGTLELLHRKGLANVFRKPLV